MKRDLHHRHHDHHDYDHHGHDYDHQQNDHQLMIIINCAQFWGGRVWENDEMMMPMQSYGVQECSW